MGKTVLLDDLEMSLYLDMTEYLSGSMLSLALSRPDIFKHEYIDGHREVQSAEALKIGSITHTLFLEPHKFCKEYHIIPNTYTNDKGEEKPWREDKRMQVVKDDIAAADGKVRMTSKQLIDAEIYADALSFNKEANEYIDGLTEATILHKGDKINFKSRPDRLYPDHDVADNIKTAQSIDAESVFSSAIKYGYDISAALTAYCYEKLFERPLKDYRFIVVEKSATTPVAVFSSNKPMFAEGSMTFLQFGAMRLKKAISQYLFCMDNSVWPADVNNWKNEPTVMKVPYWKYKEMIDERSID